MPRKHPATPNRFYRALLRLLPFDFRLEHGEEMEEVFAEQRRDVKESAGNEGVRKLWWSEILGVLRTAPREHLEGLQRDTIFALRMMRRNLGFTAVVVLTLALGIGANTALFSVVHGVLLRPLPYHEPDRLALIRLDAEGLSDIPAMSSPELTDLREQSRMFEEFAGVWSNTIALTDEEQDPEQVRYAWATRNLFSVLGVTPRLGRTFTLEEEKAEAPTSVLISHELWQRRYGGDREILGRTIRVNDEDREVIGVLPAGFRLLLGASINLATRIDVWVPQNWWGARNVRWLRVVGRLAPGATFDQAQRELDAISERIVSSHSEYDNVGLAFRVAPMHADLVREVRTGMLVLLGAVGLVLLIACSNVAGLLLSRARSREQETAIRIALGARRGQVIRQFLTESMILAMLGGAAGVALAYRAGDLLGYLRPARLPRLEDIALDGNVLAFALVSAVGTGLLFGLIPALRSSRPALQESLKGGGRAVTGRRRSRLRGALVIGQVALSVVLLIGAGLLIRTFAQLQQVDPGFDPRGVHTFQTSASVKRFESPEQWWQYFSALRDRLRAIPGAEEVGGISALPLGGRLITGSYAYDAATQENWGMLSADIRIVLPGYFETMRTRLLSGRQLEDRDVNGSRPVVMVDETLARMAWPGQNPIGRELYVDKSMGEDNPQTLEVVGVVQHVQQEQLRGQGRPQIYLPFHLWTPESVQYVIRSSLTPPALLPAVREAVEELGGGMPVHNVRTMDDLVADAMADSRFALTLMSIFAAIALLLSAVGLYGLLAFAVTQRRREIGVRLALGARRLNVLALVFRLGLGKLFWGLVLGVAGALVFSRFLESLLFGVEPTDPATFLTVALVLLAAASLACYLPARRAMRVDPVIALRQD